MDAGARAAGLSNFTFLKTRDEALFRIAFQAERYYAEDPVTAIIKLRQFAEALVRLVGARVGLTFTSQDSQIQILNQLAASELNPQVLDLLHGIRKAGNTAVHDNKGDHATALLQLRIARRLAEWYFRLTGDRAFKAPPFVPPPDPRQASDGLKAELHRLREELEAARVEAQQHRTATEQEAALRAEAESQAALRAEEAAFWASTAEAREQELRTEIDRVHAQVIDLQARVASAPNVEKQALATEVLSTASQVTLDEADTRLLIDAQLRAAGWEADTLSLTHAAGARPQKGKSLAIAEWPTPNGRADYVLFAGLVPVCVVEAKKKNTDVAASIEQAKRYSRGYQPEGEQHDPGGPWNGYRIPFLFSTNGRPFHRQVIEKSGIWFLDARRPQNHPRALEGWYMPQGLVDLLGRNEDAACEKLHAEPAQYLDLRPYQFEAIAAVESALEAGRREVLIAMATGTGKTRTCIGLVYRLLKAKRFHRVLFLVDRSALGEQALNAFKDVRLEQLQTFNDIYEVKGLADVTPTPTTRLHVATIQGMMRRLLLPREDDPPVPVDQYDCVVVDECHRGYTLDRDMSEAELSFRSLDDYVSKYRRVLDHFDAVKIGLTATPALHTVQIFGEPAYRYSYRQAVIEDYLVDHEPPIRIVTVLAEDGMTWEAPAVVKMLDLSTREIDTVHMPDELTLEVEAFNQRVLTENFNRVVCEVLAEHIDPTLAGKTLVYCVNDLHADTVVRLLKEAMDSRYGGVDDEAIVKITSKADLPLERIRRLKNEQLPSIAVTVDLLTTGIDVPEITNLVFLRRVKSRILYEQMLGRATRLCPEIDKEAFKIYDAVDLYTEMQAHTDMKPVVVNPQIPLGHLVTELLHCEVDGARHQILDELLGRLQRRQRRITGDRLQAFETMTGMTPEQVLSMLRTAPIAQAVAWFAEQPYLAQFLESLNGDGRKLIVSEHPDEVRRVERGYGNADRPQDYLEAFSRYVREHLNEIPALLVVTQRPRDLTRQDLRELKLELDRAGFSEANLRTAVKETTSQDIAASIIGYVRQGALGSPLLPYGERVDGAVKRILSSQAWSEPQRKWLEKIALQLKAETIVDREALDRGQFKQQGGYNRINRVFEGRLDELLGNLHETIWNDLQSA